MGESKQILSVSQIRQYVKCPHRYYMERILKLSRPMPGAVALGSAAHKAFEINARAKLKAGEDEPLSVLQDAFIESFRAQKERFKFEEDDPEDRCESDGLQIIKAYANEVAPVTNPIEVEKEITIPLIDRPYDVMGIIDLKEKGDTQRRKIITDYKTSKRKPAGNAIHNNLQFTAYSWLEAERPDAKQNTVVNLKCTTFVRPQKTVGAQVIEEPTTREPKDWLRFFKLADDVSKAIQAGNFPRTSPEVWWCSEKWCPYFNDC